MSDNPQTNDAAASPAERCVMRCMVSGNPCGTDTQVIGRPCQCENCKNAKLYPCKDCGKMRNQNEGGTTFTVCDECWDKHFGKDKTPAFTDCLE